MTPTLDSRTLAALVQLRKTPRISAKALGVAMGCTRNCAHLYLSRLRDQKLVECPDTRTHTGGRPEFLWAPTEKGLVHDVVPARLPSRGPAKRKPKAPKLVVAVRPVTVLDGITTVQRALRSQPDLATVWNDNRAAA